MATAELLLRFARRAAEDASQSDVYTALAEASVEAGADAAVVLRVDESGDLVPVASCGLEPVVTAVWGAGQANRPGADLRIASNGVLQRDLELPIERDQHLAGVLVLLYRAPTAPDATHVRLEKGLVALTVSSLGQVERRLREADAWHDLANLVNQMMLGVELFELLLSRDDARAMRGLTERLSGVVHRAAEAIERSRRNSDAQDVTGVTLARRG